MPTSWYSQLVLDVSWAARDASPLFGADLGIHLGRRSPAE